jgi:hypothetical protein
LVPVVPAGRAVVVIESAAGVALAVATTIEREEDLVKAGYEESVRVKPTGNVPVTEGVPLRIPVEASVIPAGSLPELRDHL